MILPPGVANSPIVSISLSDRAKSKMAKFSSTRVNLTVFDRVMTSFCWTNQRSATCAADLRCPAAA